MTDKKGMKKVGVLGIGVEGRATLKYFSSREGVSLTALDRNPVELDLKGVDSVIGQAHLENLGRFDAVFRSPGIRPDHPALMSAVERGTRVTSALDFFLGECPCPVVGVTGTVGKGTCSSLIAAALEASGFTVHLGGNIGKSPLEFLAEVKPDHRVVLEISSFQAMDLTVSPSVAVILKTTSEHLDWHVDTEEYRRAKANLLAHQSHGDTVIYHLDSPGSREISQKTSAARLAYSTENKVERGVYAQEDSAFLVLDGEPRPLPLKLRDAALPGRFNRENIFAGILAAIRCGGDIEAVCRAAQEFESLPHRLELAASAKGIRYVNDSYATRPDAAMAALTAFDEPLAVIMGGSEKNADFTQLVQVIHSRKNIVHLGLIGATASRLETAIRESSNPGFKMKIYETMEAAMEGGTDALDDRGVVLLAPACASFGMFPNYKVRGERFRAKAQHLANAGV